ncbi:unnamed protein product [Phaedon cochleariae]|uniref:Rab-GAP TBC domain-containing protein n=1 Tax=Phaedon cochleariae TaxID=80249 RepID=A0A9N9SHW9_PHACE|nr:unnamed protein product [Phaedon cochleariae]
MSTNVYEYESFSCQSLPGSINNADKLIEESNSTSDNETSRKEKNSSSSQSWFKTWPDRYDKLRSTDTTPLHSPNEDKTQLESKCNSSETETPKTTFTLQEALQNISLAYSPVTKQLHFIETTPDHPNEKHIPNEETIKIEEINAKKFGHRRIEAGSFSSTVSTLSGISDASTSGSLIGSEDRHVFSWRGVSTESNNFGNNVWKMFGKQTYESVPAASINGVASSSALIQHKRHSNKKTYDLWWHGLPSSVRGKVWKLAIGNDLNLTQQLYEICLCRAQNRLNSLEPPQNEHGIDQESSLDVIRLDISRTFPQLCIFQEGGPYSEALHSLLAAYVCYRPDVGYVQGMSYIAAILILNMEPYEAFICFSNMLNQPLHLSAFTLNQAQMQAYYNAYNQVFCHNLPKLHSHFEKSGLTPDLYLLDWIYTIFAKAMPLDIACRVWDVFLRDGQEFIFRTALGILHLHRHNLMDMDFLHGAQFLTKLPEDISSDQLFRSIQLVSTTIGKQTFTQIVEKCVVSLSESYS